MQKFVGDVFMAAVIPHLCKLVNWVKPQFDQKR
uniref:Uncharacterized protein n=1 Tax=Romanomermis culicivorax TaxID=13658 RepID=A0A915IRD7_ROMCU